MAKFRQWIVHGRRYYLKAVMVHVLENLGMKNWILKLSFSCGA
jgi:hypothetical protein